MKADRTNKSASAQHLIAEASTPGRTPALCSCSGRRPARFLASRVGAALAGACLAMPSLAQPLSLEWQAIPALNALGSSLISWDPDGPGPQNPRLVAGGEFSIAGTTVVNSIANCDGTTWRPFGIGMDGAIPNVASLAIWDPDGPGPLVPQVVAGGGFFQAGTTSAEGVARWDGSAWRAFGTGLLGYVSAVTVWDPDGSGPVLPSVVATGGFRLPSNSNDRGIAVWSGSAWQSVGGGLGGSQLPNGFALTTWDPDGPGPLPASLVAGGDFTAAGGFPFNRIARFDATAWRAIGTGVDGTVFALTTWDPDGDGPARAELVAGGNFNNAGGLASRGVARWNGQAWVPMPGINGTVYALTVWDVDGAGPLTPQLIAGGTFPSVGSVFTPVDKIARWDGTTWRPLTTTTGGVSAIYAMTVWDPDGTGPEAARLAVTGSFSNLGGTPVANIAVMSPASPAACRADFDGINGRTIDDIFIYLNAWFALDPRADVSTPADGVNVDDIFIFLNLWFAGC